MHLPALLLALLTASLPTESSFSPPLEPGPPVAARPGTALGGRAVLSLDLSSSAAVAAAAAALWGAATLEGEPSGCRWCEPGALDRGARDALRWGDPTAAGELSDALRLAVPLGSAAAAGWLALRDGGPREAAEDVLAIAGALAVVAPVTDLSKKSAGRLRPAAWAATGGGEGTNVHSFFSGHTSTVFAAAVAAAQVGRLRGRPGWRWLGAAAILAATATGYLRIGADQHWATDVLAGAAAGAAAGWAVPALALRPRTGGPPAVLPAPGGLAVRF